MNTVDNILQKLYDDPAEVEKMAQEEFQKRAQYEAQVNAILEFDKVAEEAQLDVSQMSDVEKLQLYVALSQQLAQMEGEQGVQGGVQPQMAQPAQAPASAQAVAPVQTQAPEVPGQASEEFQMKVAENLYFSDMFGKNAAHSFWNRLQDFQKSAEEGHDEKPEDKKEDGSPAFEALAKERAAEM